MKMESSLEFDLDQLQEALQEKRDAVLDVLYQHAYNACPVRTGRMRDSITAQKEDDFAVVSVNTEYASYTEYRGSSAGWFSTAMEEANSEVEQIWQTI